MIRDFGLDSLICVDGVELVHRTYPEFVGRSEKNERRRIRDAVKLEDALVVRFINANTDDKRIAFFSAFGLPLGDMGLPGLDIGATPRAVVLRMQRDLSHLLQEAGSGNAARATKAANQALRSVGPDQRSLEPDGRMVWIVGEALSFMYLEIAATAANRAHLGACRRCGAVFLYGHGTGGRKTRHYCDDACRQGAGRARKHK